MKCEYGKEIVAICDKMANIDRTLLRNRRGGEAIAQLEGLLKQYREAANKEPVRACRQLRDNLLFNLGCAYEQDGNLEKAVQIHEELLQLNPNDHQAMYNAGTNLVKLGNLDQAIPLLKKAVELNPGDANYRQNLDEALRKKRLRDHTEEQGPWLTRNNRWGGPIC